MSAATKNPNEAFEQKHRCKSLHSIYQCQLNEGHDGRHEYIDNPREVHLWWNDEEEDAELKVAQ